MRWRRQPHAAREFVRLFIEALFKHRKRGNRHIPPLGIVKSWRMGQCARMIILGPPYRLGWMRKAVNPTGLAFDYEAEVARADLPSAEGGGYERQERL